VLALLGSLPLADDDAPDPDDALDPDAPPDPLVVPRSAFALALLAAVVVTREALAPATPR
jgi:hypothetical protein